MDTIKQLCDVEPRDLAVVERVFGRTLDPTANIVLILRDTDTTTTADADTPRGDTLPEWCDMYAGLSEAQIADLESVILKRADLARTVEYHPLAPFAGMLKDDPSAEPWKEAMADNRRAVD